ncbi:right-handed parallel beta-helix repeat-containing protein [Streptomyces purpureus]|uniref:right-handed parallel beta-helix repeat-containing protein n=1 Tax=Streptomyces purpureus TaxID=1951 RepID=UPI00166F983F|nr:right-handed parallel beta-helix repeat-containing protein [Streptomyces purpureus]
MTRQKLTCLACTAVVIVTGVGAAAPSGAATTHTVQLGESIQAAVDAAKPGDSIVLAEGVHHGSVRITTSNLTLRGQGEGTVLVPATAATRADSACATAGNGICVTGTAAKTVDGVTIRGLTLSGYKKNGLWATRTDRLEVRDVTAEKNGSWGLAQERSTRGVFRNNIARDNAESGIFVANTIDREGGAIDTHGAVIRDNTLTGNRIGVTVRRVRNLSVRNNTISANCGGVFVVGDETKPWAGAMTIRNNYIFENNKFCPGNSRLPVIQGTGIVLTGSEQTVVRNNLVRNNVGSSPLSGGIVLFQSFVGAQNVKNRVENNVLVGNKSADLANRGTGTGNTFQRNTCEISEPTGMC